MFEAMLKTPIEATASSRTGRARRATRAVVTIGITALTAAALALPSRGQAQTAAPYLGTPPREGEVALMQTSIAVTPAALASALNEDRCSAEVIAITANGQWLIFVPGAPAFVNERFPASLAQWTGFFVRCRALAVPPSPSSPTPAPGS